MSVVDIQRQLSDLEVGNLRVLERIIERGQKAFVEVADALLAIRDLRLYRTYGTFEAYCQERWGFKRAQAYRMIDAAKVTQIVSPIGDMPANEAQARELVPLLDDPEGMREAWIAASADGKPTAAKVRSVVQAKRVRVDRCDDVDDLDDIDPAGADRRRAIGTRRATADRSSSGPITQHIRSQVVELWWLGELGWPLENFVPKKMYREKKYRPPHLQDEHEVYMEMVDGAIAFLEAIRGKLASESEAW